MLEIISGKSETLFAQRQLETRIKSVLKSQGRRNIGYPGGNSNHVVYAGIGGSLYCAFAPPQADSGVPRYWNSFGTFEPSAQSLQITVEINIPVSGSDARVAGLFARDSDTGGIYLMHSGAIGGGRPGVSQRNFLEYLSDKTVEVRDGNRIRQALPIGGLDDPNLVALIWRFAQRVSDFKRYVTSQPGSVPPNQDSPYSPEPHGERRGERSATFDYFTYHGMIVDALKVEREQHLSPVERICKNPLVDLFVTSGGARTEVYEVKTSCGRQSLYTAIGQLMTHGGTDGIARTMVLPANEKIPQDCHDALEALKIATRRYKLRGKGLSAQIELLPPV